MPTGEGGGHNGFGTNVYDFTHCTRKLEDIINGHCHLQYILITFEDFLLCFYINVIYFIQVAHVVLNYCS